MTQRHAWAAIAVVIFLMGCSPAQLIVITGAWLRPPAPGLEVAAGYFDIVNHGKASIDLIGARSNASGAIEIHTEMQDGDMMQMRQLDKVVLPPDQTVSFSPGATHLMLLEFSGVTSPRVAITLLFSDGSQQVVAFEMRSLSGANPS